MGLNIAPTSCIVGGRGCSLLEPEKHSQSPELSLLLSCSRTYVGSEAEKSIHHFAGAVNWPELARLTHQHGVAPLVFRNLDRFAGGGVPEAVHAELRNAFDVNAFSTSRLTLELLSIVKLLSAHGIASVTFKGPVLARMAEGLRGRAGRCHPRPSWNPPDRTRPAPRS